MRTRARAVGLVGVALAAMLGSAPAPAGAASSVESGWWTSSPLAAAPDVSSEQLLVQGGADPSQPLAYAGISFTLEPDETPVKLVLEIAPDSASTPGAPLALCRLEAPATPAGGEAATDGPGFDCASKFEATPSSEEATYEFDLSQLEGRMSLDVAVIPTGPTARIVLSKPGADALQSITGTSDSSLSFSESTEGGTTVSPGSSEVSGDAFSPGSVTFDLPQLPAPSPPGPAPAGQPGGAAPNVSQLAVAAASQRPFGGGADDGPIAAYAFIGLALGAAALWVVAGRQSLDPAGDPT